jgi:hypothetical protein
VDGAATGHEIEGAFAVGSAGNRWPTGHDPEGIARQYMELRAQTGMLVSAAGARLVMELRTHRGRALGVAVAVAVAKY